MDWVIERKRDGLRERRRRAEERERERQRRSEKAKERERQKKGEGNRVDYTALQPSSASILLCFGFLRFLVSISIITHNFFYCQNSNGPATKRMKFLSRQKVFFYSHHPISVSSNSLAIFCLLLAFVSVAYCHPFFRFSLINYATTLTYCECIVREQAFLGLILLVFPHGLWLKTKKMSIYQQ